MAERNPPGPPFSLRLTQEERKALDALADGQPLGAYIKDAIFNREVRPRTRGQKPVRDKAALARLLGLLGQSRISQNINQLAKAANTGSLPLNAEVHRALLESCESIKAMRSLLMVALGLQADAGTGKDSDGAP
ncbi:MAG: plasmid mobilization relaxosome protein MobC [Pseudomonadota bacterium]